MRAVAQPLAARGADVAGLVAYLAGPAAGWIIGQTYPINGGYSHNRCRRASAQTRSAVSSIEPAMGPPPLPIAATFGFANCRPSASPRSCRTAS